MNTITLAVNRVDIACRAPMTFARVLRAYLVEAKYECLRMLRTPAFAIPFLALPIFLYLLIGVLVVGQSTNADPRLPLFMFTAFVVFAATSPGMFSFGQGLAVERQSGVLNLKRAQPMPAAAYVVAKILMALASATIVMIVLIPLAIAFGHISLTAAQIVGVAGAGVLGTVTFCAIGLFIGTLVSGTAAPAVVNLIYFPMMYLSGMFFPLPKILAPWALMWPTFYLDQLVYSAGGGRSAIAANICAAVLVGLTVLCGGLAVRRLARLG